jgi:hypothetical protein
MGRSRRHRAVRKVDRRCFECVFIVFSWPFRPGAVVLDISRDNVVADSFATLRNLKVRGGLGLELAFLFLVFMRMSAFQRVDYQRQLEVRFKGEQGVDVGGLTKEWCLLFSRQIQLAQFKLFRETPCKNGTLDVHPFVPASQRALFCMRLIGR